MARKREKARALGFCARCCNEKPADGRVICRTCHNRMVKITRSRRHKGRQAAELRQMVEAHERAGDRASKHHLYEDASQWYHKALSLQAITHRDQLRITEKLQKVYFLGENPSAAAPLANWLAKSYSASAEGWEKAIESLIDVATQLFMDSKTEQALPVLAQAAQIAEAAGLRKLRTIVDLQRVRYLHLLERYHEARLLLEVVMEPAEPEVSSLRFFYYREKSEAAAVLGEAEEVHRCFGRALAAAKESSNVHSITQAWGYYGFLSWRLGDIEHAKSCFESAILVARENQVLWRVSHLHVCYAEILATMGQYTTAREHLLKAFAYEARAPMLEVAIARVGIPLALRLEDIALLKRCGQPASISKAWQDGNPTNIGAVAAAHAHLSVFQGQHGRARELLHRALPCIRQLDENWHFLLAVAQYGNRTDLPAARAFIERRLEFPHHNVAAACLSLFDAFAAQRSRSSGRVRACALKAARQFNALHWHGYAETAGALIDPGARSLVGEINNSPLATMEPALTLREQQVAELVLKGLSNRDIATTLSIAERTVEAHMTSIMGRLGVRSRHQLKDILIEP